MDDVGVTLSDYRTFDQVLTKQRLEDHGTIDVLEDGGAILRGMRNIG
ncbi:hypothetical protein PM030_16185 [Halorubrum ezzemoulense]|nr:hypothetical protein [Halorubrum ezzemoulense]MDB2283402.1 hypothetical protein [Halorubrum ezzemoulense]